MKYKQEGLEIVTYREPEPRHIEWGAVAMGLAMLAILGAVTTVANLCVAYGF